MPTSAEVASPSLQRKLKLFGYLVKYLIIRMKEPLRVALRVAARLKLTDSSVPEFARLAEDRRTRRLAEMYDITARIYESRGQIGQAVALWRHAEPLHDVDIESHACQQSLKDPEATYESLAALQQRWVDRHIGQTLSEQAPAFREYTRDRKLRIGYHCSFMDSDTIRYIMRRVMRAHDRTKFEVIGYAPSALPPDMQEPFQIARNTAGLSDRAFAELVRGDNIDVFVEMSGFSIGHRFGAMALRCAPVQISYLNHFGTSRVPNVDYLLTDNTCTPSIAEIQATFSETIYPLPGCLLRYDYTDGNGPGVSPSPWVKNGFVTFGCFGSANKINTKNIALWSEVMRRVPGSKILLQHSQFDPPDNRRYAVDRFRRYGIEAERVMVRPGTSRIGILEAYSEVDISFDTWPYCGGNTLAESLWQGVPVVSLKGELLCARYGASLLETAGLPELIADTEDQYVQIAVDLANGPDRMRALRQDMRLLYTTTGLNDSASFARNLEHAYLEMIKRWSDKSRQETTNSGSLPPTRTATTN